MAKGRKRLPDEIKKVRVTDQPCRMTPTIKGEIITDIEAVLTNKSVAALSNDRQKEIFLERVKYMMALKMMEMAYIDQLVDYAIFREKYEVTLVKLEQMGGEFVKRYDDTGKVCGFIENPYIKLAIKYRDITNKIGSEFGFTPVSRMKLPTSEVKESPLEQIRKIVNGK